VVNFKWANETATDGLIQKLPLEAIYIPLYPPSEVGRRESYGKKES